MKGSAETFGFLLERWLRTHVRQIAVTPRPLAELMTDIRCGRPRRRRVRTVLDPACGTGTLLLSAGRRWGDSEGGSRTGRARGQDRDPVLVSLTRAQLARRRLHRATPTGDHSHGRGHPARRCPCGCTGRCGPVQPAR
ncbi:N-6 DNA methylase [Streptomyces sp. L7]